MTEVKDYPPYLDYPKPHKAQTNADRIRSMTDEELAMFLCDFRSSTSFSLTFMCFLLIHPCAAVGTVVP